MKLPDKPEFAALTGHNWLSKASFEAWYDKRFAGARQVYGHYRDGIFWNWDEQPRQGDTHTALVIEYEPIAKPDTAESLLRAIVEKYDFVEHDVFRRAKAYLNK